MVLQNILGGGASMSQDGVAGSQSRLACNVLNENVLFYAFSSTYRDAGIFDLYGACVGGSQDSTLSALKEMESVASKACDGPELVEQNSIKSYCCLQFGLTQWKFGRYGNTSNDVWWC